MANQAPVTQDVTKLLEKIQEIKYATFTTLSAEQRLHGRPMYTCKPGLDGVLWFLSEKDAQKIVEIQANPQIGLGYSDLDAAMYVTIAGRATVTEDKDKIKELWREDFRGYFPGGADDPTIAVIKVEIEAGEYWESAGNLLTQAYAYAKVLVTGKKYEPTPEENSKVEPA